MSDTEEYFGIRDIENADLDAWVALRHKLWPENSADDLRVSSADFFDGESTLWFVVVAASEDKLIGMIEVSLRSYAEGAESNPVPFIEGWFVEEEYRGRGVGAALIEAVEEACRAEGYTELCSDTLAEHVDSHAAHKAVGFREVERIVCFHKSL